METPTTPIDTYWQTKGKFAQAYRILGEFKIEQTATADPNADPKMPWPGVTHRLRIPMPVPNPEVVPLLDCDFFDTSTFAEGCSKAHAGARRSLWVRLVCHLVNVFDIRKDEIYSDSGP